MEHVPRRLALVALAILCTLAFGTAGFVIIEGYPVFDAFYMTLTTVTTVGYGEIRTLSHAGRIFNSFLISFGVLVIFLAVGAMTQTAIELELNQFFGKRRVKNMIEKLEGIADSFHGVSKAFALQAGREIRIVVESETVSDEETVWLSKDIARRIENELEYPGQIKVTVIRETRAVDYAK